MEDFKALKLFFFLFGLIPFCAHAQNRIPKDTIDHMMGLSVHQFDQTEAGWRKYAEFYPEVVGLMSQYLSINNVSYSKAANIRWHIGQIHAGNDEYQNAIESMKLSYVKEAPPWWNLYVQGTIAFLEKDKKALEQAIDLLKKENNQTNLDVLLKLFAGFDKTYKEALN